MTDNASKTLDIETSVVWHFTDRKYRESHRSLLGSVDWGKFNWPRALAYSCRNGVLYRFCKQAMDNIGDSLNDSVRRNVMKIIRNGDVDLKRLLNTLHTIKELWDGQTGYYIIKTHDDMPTYDVDILFLNAIDYEYAIDLATRRKMVFVREEPFKGWIGVERGVKIELHLGISWFGMKALSNHLFAASHNRTRLAGLEFPTINDEAAIALDLAHWIIDIQPLTIRSFSNLLTNIEKAKDWDEIFNQAQQFGWKEQLDYYLNVFIKLHEHVYTNSLDLPVKPSSVSVRPCFPFSIPAYVKVPFLTKKTISDNVGPKRKLTMLQLAMRRYAFARMRGWT